MSKPYQIAPGRSRGIGSYRSLWFGEHDLLQVHYLPGREDYDHLFYRDICAIYIMPNKRWHWRVGIGLAVLIGLVVVALTAASRDQTLFIGLFSFLGIPCLLIVLNDLLRGPTCECYAVTAVQRYQLHAWNRIRLAKRCATKLRERVVQAQQA